MDNSWILGPVVSIASIIIGWFLGQINQWAKQKKEDNSRYNEALFGLLELYYNLLRLDNKHLIDKATKAIKDRMTENNNAEFPEEYLKKALNDFINQFLKDELLSQLNEAKTSYMDSINILKPIDPITAFKLNGKENVFEKIEEYLANISDQFEYDASKTMIGFSELIKNVILEISLDDIKDAILNIAGRINKKTLKSVKTTIQKINLKNNDSVDKYFSVLFDYLEKQYELE